MSNDSKRVSELGITTTLQANDRVVVLTNPNTSAQTQTISVGNLGYSLTQNAIPIANATQLGIVKIGPGLVVAANGVVSAPIPVANQVQLGVVKIGNGINVNANGVISVNINQDTNFTNVSSDIIPSSNNTYSLGNSTHQWKSLYVSNNTIYIGGTPLSVDNQGVLLVNNTPVVANTGTITFANATLSTSNGDVIIQAPAGNVNIISQGSQFTFDNHIGRFIMPSGGDITSETGTFTISNAQYIAFNNNDMYVGEGMGPWVFSNNSLFVGSQYYTNSAYGYQGSQTYLGKYQFFVNDYYPNSSTSYAVTLRNDGTLISDATIISNQDIISNNNILAGNNLTVNKNIYFSGNIYDELKRPIYNPNALDINTDGGTSLAVFTKTDPAFDGGAGETVFGLYEAALDGGVSFNNKHSASYIDGGGANQF
jgi:hypothetical protein